MNSCANNWQPSCSLETLKARAQVLEDIRAFFKHRQVLEVQTPVLARTAIPETHINLFKSCYRHEEDLYLQASPEAMMKRLLAAGAGSIYQISPVFRDGEQGRWHNPEFTLLEWYRVDFDHHDLMMEVEALLRALLPGNVLAERVAYNALFLEYLGLHPLQTPVSELHSLIERRCPAIAELNKAGRDLCLQYLFSELIEPELKKRGVVFVYDYPANQASLAQICPENNAAARFEVYVDGIELGNGFHELREPTEQLQRFEKEQAEKQTLGQPSAPIDMNLIAALEAGIPACAGVAIGLERLLMLKTNASHIQEVCSFAINRV